MVGKMCIYYSKAGHISGDDIFAFVTRLSIFKSLSLIINLHVNISVLENKLSVFHHKNDQLYSNSNEMA